jgi:hypothetical protein
MLVCLICCLSVVGAQAAMVHQVALAVVLAVAVAT